MRLTLALGVRLMSLPAITPKRDAFIRLRKTSKQLNRNHNLQHPYAHINQNKSHSINCLTLKDKDSKKMFEGAILSVFQKLGITREKKYWSSNDLTLQDSLTLPEYIDPYKEQKENAPSVNNIGRFVFNKEKYPVTARMINAESPYVADSRDQIIDENSPLACKAHEIKGIRSRYLESVPVYPHNIPVYDCEFFSLRFYHKTHFFSRIRKSNPAILFSNGTGSRIPELENNPSSTQFNNALKPFKFAVYRGKARKLIRNEFFKIYELRNKQIRDGLYGIHVKAAPLVREVDSLKLHLEKAFEVVDSLKEKVLIAQSRKVEEKINWKSLNASLQLAPGNQLLPLHSNKASAEKRASAKQIEVKKSNKKRQSNSVRPEN